MHVKTYVMILVTILSRQTVYVGNGFHSFVDVGNAKKSCSRDRHERCSYRYKTAQEKDTEMSNLNAAKSKVKNIKEKIEKYAKIIERCLQDINERVIYYTQVSLDGDLTGKDINEIMSDARKWTNFLEKINEILD